MSNIEMNVMDPTGHTKHIWDSSNAAEVEAAKELFNSLTKKGYRAFHVKKDGSEGEIMSKFDKDAEKVIFAPHLQGG